MGRICSPTVHVLAAEQNKEPRVSHWSICRLSLNLFVFSMKPHTFFHLCLGIQSSEVQIFKRLNLWSSTWVREGQFLAAWIGRGNLVTSFEDFQWVIPYEFGPTTASTSQFSKIPIVSSIHNLSKVQQSESAVFLLANTTLSSPLAWNSPKSALPVTTGPRWSFAICCWHPSCIPTSSMPLLFWAVPNFVHLFAYCHSRRLFERNQETMHIFNLPFWSDVL